MQGLGAHPYGTWVKRNGKSVVKDLQSPSPNTRDSGKKGKSEPKHIPHDEEIEVCMWPRDLLVNDIATARIATYAYKSNWRDKEIRTDLHECAVTLLNSLKQNRQEQQVSSTFQCGY